MISKRRLIALIGGRAAAGDGNAHIPLAAQPQVTRALQRASVAVAGAGVAAVLLLGVGSSVLSSAAAAAASAGSGYGSGGGRSDATVSELASSEPVEASSAEVEGVAGDPVVGIMVGKAVAAPGQVLRARSELQGIVAPPTTSSTTTSTTAPPPTTTAPAPTPDPGSVQAIIHEVFGAHGSQAIGVARCESGLNPGAVSRGGGNWGLFQINTVHRSRVAQMGYQWEDLLDPRVNSLVALSIFEEQGWSPWGCRHAAR